MRVLLGILTGLAILAIPVSASAQATVANTPLGFLFQTFAPRSYAPPQPPAYQRPYQRRPAYQQQPNSRPFANRMPRQQYAPQGYQRARFGLFGGGVAPRQPAVNQSQINPELRRQMVAVNFNYEPGTIVIDTNSRFLYLTMENGQAMRYGVGVGRQGFNWKGKATIQRKAEWPAWVPPKEMRKREPWLPARMEGGEDNPLGARALYLYEGGKDTLYRIHGTNQPSTIGQAVSSGCIRMLNEDVMDLYDRVPKGTKVVVI